MEEFRSPPLTMTPSYQRDRNLKLVDPITLRPIKRIYVVRESSSQSRSLSSTSFDQCRQFPYKKLPSKRKKSSHSSSLKGWWNDPEVKRKRRVAKYKLYSAEGKVKASLRRGLKWVKVQCSKIIHGI